MAYGDSGDSEIASGPSEVEAGSSDELLSLCRQEKARAVGFDNDAELRDDVERALNYYKGDVSKDMPSLPNRSRAVSSEVSDAIETILPDLMEIFTGGDDTVAFIPQNEKDVEGAKQETAYLHHVVFQDNDGFLNFYTAFKDALTVKRGIFHWEYEEDINDSEEVFKGKNAIELQLAAESGEISNVKADPLDPDMPSAEPTYSFTVTKTKDNSTAKYYAVDPADFAASPDTINIADTTYCCMRARPRAQDLIAEGYDETKVRNLPQYGVDGDEQIKLARDTAGENTQSGSTGDDTSDDLRQVEVFKHYIRKLGDDNELEIWCLVTDRDTVNELERYKVKRIPFASGSPYIVAHRLIGLSLADMLIQVQQIKTALTRMVLDSGYFALNQRHEVAMDQANDFTISDLLRNEPMVPVRSKTGAAVRPLTAGGLQFDAYKALEYFSTVAEQRTGVVRNAQGLNPDTLHDTAKGAMMLLSAAQKRTRMIARVLAETLVKPFYLGMHAEIRENACSTKIAQLLGKWVPVDPTKWAERNAMTVEVGLGAAGKDAEIAAMTQIIGLQKAIVEGGGYGKLITDQDIYKSATDMSKKLGVKAPEEYFTDPSTVPPQPPKPDPEMVKVQGEQALQQQKQQGEMALGQMKVQAEKEIQANKSSMQAAADQHKQQLEHERELQKQADAMALEQVRIQSAERIAIAVARINAEAKISAAQVAAKTDDGAEDEAYQRSHESAPA